MSPAVRTVVRVGFALVVVLSLGVVVHGYVDGTELRDRERDYGRDGQAFGRGEQMVEPRPNGTVITTSERRDGGRDNLLVAFSSCGAATTMVGPSMRRTTISAPASNGGPFTCTSHSPGTGCRS